MRSFVAVFPDEAVNAAVDAAVAGLDDGWRPVARERRHVTVRFHADADPEVVGADLRRGLAAGAHRPPALRCAGAGIFGTALWLGVRADDAAAWDRLLVAAGADPAGHVAHLTVARGRSGRVPSDLAAHEGPVWVPPELVLVASGAPYRVIEEFPLVGGTGADESVGRPR